MQLRWYLLLILCCDLAAPLRSSAMQWSFTNNVTAHPQYLSFKSAPEDKPKIGFDSLASTGLVTITTTEAVDSSHRTYSDVTQVCYGSS